MPRKKAKKLDLIPPGEILTEEFLTPLGVSQSRLARDLNVPVRRINEICLGKRSITPDTALRLSTYFGTTPEFWLNLQTHFDLELIKESKQDLIAQEVRPLDRSAA